MASFYMWYIWLAATLLAACLAGAGAKRRRPLRPGNSGNIMDMIDMEYVEKLQESRKEAEPSESPYNGITYVPDQENDTKNTTPIIIDFRNILKSSNKGTIMIKKEFLKEDWCKTKTFKQEIREKGCRSETVENNFCYGQCDSFYIPKPPRRWQSGDERPPRAFKTCGFCQPIKYTWMVLTLHCPGLNPPYKFKRVQYVEQCQCVTMVGKRCHVGRS